MNRRKLKNEIIQKSLDLFRQRGYDAVSVQDICDACDITKPTFYKYLASKQTLLSYFFSSMAEAIPDDWYRIPEGTDCYQKILDGYLMFMRHACDLGPDLYNQVFISNLEEYMGTFNDVPAITDLMVDLIREAQECGQIGNPSDPKSLYKAGVGMSLGYGAYWCLDEGRCNILEDFCRDLGAVFMHQDPAGKEVKA